MSRPRFRGVWERELRAACDVHKGNKATALMLATFATDNGNNARPGVALLAQCLQATDRYVRMNLRELVKFGWIEKVSTGSLRGTKGAANCYRLTLPDAYWARDRDGVIRQHHGKQVSGGGEAG